MQAVGRDPEMVRVSFSLDRLSALTPCELEVARWANAGHSNAAIAALRGTSIHTVAGQIASVYLKLGIGARVGLATIAELCAWAPAGLGATGSQVDAASCVPSGDGVDLDLSEVARIWGELALGSWRAVASVDIGGTSHVAVRRVGAKTIDWTRLSARQRDVIELSAFGLAQKVVAIKLGLAPSTVSSVLASVKRRFGFATLGHLVRAYGASGDTDDALAHRRIERTSSCNQE
jgi:DNA-binding CsgD family transcriptional regulator